MKFELNLEEPDPARAVRSASTIGVSYVVGGLIPLAPYFAMRDLGTALIASVAVTISALFIFGGVKARFTEFYLAGRCPNRLDWRPCSGGRVCNRTTISVTQFESHCAATTTTVRLVVELYPQ